MDKQAKKRSREGERKRWQTEREAELLHTVIEMLRFARFRLSERKRAAHEKELAEKVAVSPSRPDEIVAILNQHDGVCGRRKKYYPGCSPKKGKKQNIKRRGKQ